MAKYVYEFSEGNKDLKDLLGGKGANLAEMTNLGLPVPPGFTITTDACRTYMQTGDLPPELRVEVTHGAAPARGHARALARRRPRPAAGLGALRRQVLDARHDGDRPERRPQRRLGPGPRQVLRRRALRVGLLPPPDPDVRQDGARHRRRPVRRRAGRQEEGQGRRDRHRADRRRPARAGRPSSSRSSSRSPAASSRSTRASSSTWPSRPSSTRGTPTARACTAAASASRTTSAPRSTSWPWCSATSARTRAPACASRATPPPACPATTATTCRTPRARTSSRASATPSRWRTSSKLDHDAFAELRQRDAPPGDPLPRPVRHRVHGRARQAVDAADPRGQAHRRGGVPHREPARRRAPHHHGRGARAGHRRAAEQADVPAVRRRPPSAPCSAKGMAASPGAAVGEAVFSLGDRPGVGGRRARTSSWCAARRTPTTWAA